MIVVQSPTFHGPDIDLLGLQKWQETGEKVCFLETEKDFALVSSK